MGNDNSPLSIDPQDLSNLEGILKILKNNIFTTLNVCMPCNVISYNPEDNTADLQPAIQRVLQDNTFQDRSVLSNVPVLELGGNGLSIKIPLKEGDTGIVIFCDRDITLFKQEKSNTQPNTLRKHDLSDGIFIPMRFGNTGSSNILIQSEDEATQFEITSSGINIKGNITVDGEITATDVKTTTNVSLKDHKHGGVTTGSGSTAVPTPT